MKYNGDGSTHFVPNKQINKVRSYAEWTAPLIPQTKQPLGEALVHWIFTCYPTSMQKLASLYIAAKPWIDKSIQLYENSLFI